MIKIGVDLSSGEKNSIELFSSIDLFLKENEDVQILLFIEDSLKLSFLESYPSVNNRCEVIYTSNDINMEDIPSIYLLSKKNSAMVQGLKALKNNKISAFFSPGNSGALIVLSREIIGLRKKISAIAAGILLPRFNDTALLLDAGASFNFDEERILELAYLGQEYYSIMFENQPLLGLLNVGKESYKGSLVLKRTDRFFKKEIPDTYNGFMEGFDIFKSNTNIFLTDAYTGNILLKSWEGFLSYIFSFLNNFFPQEESTSSYLEKVLSFLKTKFHYSQVGAAPLLGLKKPVFLGHGKTSIEALTGALKLMKSYLLKIEKVHTSEYIKKKSKWAKQFKRQG